MANLRQAYLSWANLRQANLRQANLRQADLSSTDLSWADLSEANLSWADLSEANLENISWNEDTKWENVQGLETAINVPEALKNHLTSP
ncbi:pentapeptide repeat-containing protein [Moorena sp. SIO2C4]|uniref:pentapeptide repeat-containing protein n=1 Tax=Moorena sp. SIO2C4 TaxID=2607824 RepID=UPI00338F0737